MGPHLSEVDLRLLRALLSEPAAHTLESLGRRLAAPPMQGAERLELLGRFGCLLDRHPQHGVRLRGTSLTCWTDYIEWRHPAGLGRRLLL